MNPHKNVINWKAKSVCDLIKWDKVDIHEPALTKHLDTKTIQQFIKSDDPPKFFYKFPCHSQSTERFIPLMANSTDKVAEKQRDGFILSIVDSRKDNSKFDTKADYKLVIKN